MRLSDICVHLIWLYRQRGSGVTQTLSPRLSVCHYLATPIYADLGQT